MFRITEKQSLRPLVLMICALLGVSTIIWRLQPPHYAGKSAHEWLDHASAAPPTPGYLPYSIPLPSKEIADSAAAFRQMGPRGVRFLINMDLPKAPFHIRYYEQLSSTLSTWITLPPWPSPQTPERKVSAHRILHYLGPEILPDLLEASRDEDGTLRSWAANLLGELGPAHPQSQTRLLQMLHDPSPEVLLDALEVMWMIEPDPEISIPLLLPLLTNTSGRVRTEASYVLGELTPLPEIAIDALTLALSDENWVVRANSARAVGRSGITSPHIAGELDKLLTDNREVAKCRAIEALARLYGPAAPECSSNFLPAMADANAMPSNPYCTLMLLNATSSLGSNPPPNAIREADLHVLLTESAAYCCSEALATLPLLRKASIETVPALVLNAYLRFLQSHENGYIRQHASLAYSNAATQQPITPSPSH